MKFFKMDLRALAAVIVGIFILVFLNWNIFQKERIIKQGRTVLLQLAPVDPRSLMQGDYMALRFALADEVRYAVHDEPVKEGIVILKLDENNVAHFERIYDEHSPLQRDEVRLKYRVLDDRGTVEIGTNAFFFEEGQGEIYESARYGEFRIADTGEATLTQLLDEKFKALGRSAVLN
ncbi:MAG: GDYXXLXY domain-containing protein [Azoarcus sp.]|jgi:uncharacterized membrane-anchored protein|nr:GDYXXLXY domain-containing protein [Azoarcus sp.]